MPFTKTSYCFEFTHFWYIWAADLSHRRKLLKTQICKAKQNKNPRQNVSYAETSGSCLELSEIA